jgi:hypothetical protein
MYYGQSLKESNTSFYSQWNCFSDVSTPYDVKVYDVENGIPIQPPAVALTVEDYHQLPVVISYTSSSSISTTASSSITTVDHATSTGETLTSSLSSVTTSTVSIVPSISTQENPQPEIIVPVIVAMVIVIGLALSCMIITVICLIIIIRKQRSRIVRLKQDVIIPVPNLLHDEVYCKEKDIEMGQLPLSNSGGPQDHIYSEVKINNTQSTEPWIPNPTYGQLPPGVKEKEEEEEWIPNPTYGCKSISLDDAALSGDHDVVMTLSSAAPDKIYDSPAHQNALTIESCPAYEQPPLLPAARKKIVKN